MIAGVRVGHWTDPVAMTGCTVVLLPEGNVTSGEVRGGAPGTREFALLEPGRLVEQVDAVVLTGGSAFGLASCDGVMRWLEERGRGHRTSVGPVPIVVGMVLFDLRTGNASVRPGPDEGYAACDDATAATDRRFSGRVGAGTGLTVGGILGPDRRRPGGLGSATITHDEVSVSALVAVNAAGDLRSAGAARSGPGAGPPPARARDGSFPAPADLDVSGSPLTNTTVGVVVTNAALDKVGCHLLAQSAHHGLARTIEPSHTRYDGDAFVTSALGHVDGDLDRLQVMTSQAVEQAIVDAVAR